MCLISVIMQAAVLVTITPQAAIDAQLGVSTKVQ